jgi:hypothetical protein
MTAEVALRVRRLWPILHLNVVRFRLNIVWLEASPPLRNAFVYDQIDAGDMTSVRPVSGERNNDDWKIYDC